MGGQEAGQHRGRDEGERPLRRRVGAPEVPDRHRQAEDPDTGGPGQDAGGEAGDRGHQQRGKQHPPGPEPQGHDRREQRGDRHQRRGGEGLDVRHGRICAFWIGGRGKIGGVTEKRDPAVFVGDASLSSLRLCRRRRACGRGAHRRTSSAQTPQKRFTGGPVTLADQGSFFVGGVTKISEYAAIPGAPPGQPPPPPTPQQITIGQMYVQFQIPGARSRARAGR